MLNEPGSSAWLKLMLVTVNVHSASRFELLTYRNGISAGS
jgi:hypothetical protein